MGAVKSDIEIARSAKMQPIQDILAKINVPNKIEAFSPIGSHIAKINLDYLEGIKDNKNSSWKELMGLNPKPSETVIDDVGNCEVRYGYSFILNYPLSILFRPSLKPTDVVVLPSPAGVGVIAVTNTSLLFLLSLIPSR